MPNYRADLRRRRDRNQSYRVHAIKRQMHGYDYIPPLDFGKLPPPSDKPGRHMPEWLEADRTTLRIAMWKLKRLGADALTAEEQDMIVFIAKTPHRGNLPSYALEFADQVVAEGNA
jgi:hypothetical protein